MLTIFLAVAALIIYGSLYPWAFRVPHGLENPLIALFTIRVFGHDRRFLADILINIALYLPLGMSGFLAFSQRQRVALRLLLPVLFGFVFSATIEMAQLYVPGRRCSWLDLLNNTLGSALGVMGAILFEAVAGRKWLLEYAVRRVDRPALALLLVWLGSLVFPLFPVLWLFVYRQKLAAMFDAPVFSPMAFISAVGSWYAAGLLLRTVDSRRIWIWDSLALIPGQFFIMARVPVPSELLGALVGTILFALRPLKFGSRPIGWAFLAIIAFRGLAPFQAGPAHAFSLVPFSGFLDMNWQTGIRILLEKSWYFGAAIWLLRAQRMPLLRAVAIVTALAGGIELLQIFSPGRVPEITDPLLALMMGFAISILRRPDNAATPEFSAKPSLPRP